MKSQNQTATGQLSQADQEVFNRHKDLTGKFKSNQARFDAVKGLLDEIDLDAAITNAALSISQNLSLDKCVPALVKAALLATMREKLTTALRMELVNGPESALAAFRDEHGETLRRLGLLE
jgi:hypothetical protein